MIDINFVGDRNKFSSGVLQYKIVFVSKYFKILHYLFIDIWFIFSLFWPFNYDHMT